MPCTRANRYVGGEEQCAESLTTRRFDNPLFLITPPLQSPDQVCPTLSRNHCLCGGRRLFRSLSLTALARQDDVHALHERHSHFKTLEIYKLSTRTSTTQNDFC